MPNKDPVIRARQLKDYRERMAKRGYHIALYRRRRQVQANEAILRSAIEDVLSNELDLRQTRKILRMALVNAPKPGPPKDFMPDPAEYVHQERPRVNPDGPKVRGSHPFKR